jgi:hypothetical protein
MKRRLCSYVVPQDTGFAPNPVGQFCTLAACTPNHQGVRLRAGDWIVGTEPSSRGNKLVYAMQVSEVLNFDTYFVDGRFEYKKPRPVSDWRIRCGDNIYHREGGVWRQEWSPFHNQPWQLQQDTRHPRVFVAEEYFYFGENATPIPSQFSDIIWKRQGCRCSYPTALVDSFVEWLRYTYPPGTHGLPRDREQTDDERLISLMRKPEK